MTGPSRLARRSAARRASWPLAEWGKLGRQYDYRCTTCFQVVALALPAAATVIDWSDLGSASATGTGRWPTRRWSGSGAAWPASGAARRSSP